MVGSAYFHNNESAIVMDGKIVAAVQEELFSRIRHDASFTQNANRYVLEESGFHFEKLSAIAFCKKSLLKIQRFMDKFSQPI